MRQIVLDTETTGFCADTDSIIEIGCVELIAGKRTGNTFHRLINPYGDDTELDDGPDTEFDDFTEENIDALARFIGKGAADDFAENWNGASIDERKAALENIGDAIDDEFDDGISIGAGHIHGITTDDLEGRPSFKDIADDLLAFIKGAEIIAHNAPFDVKFLDAEFDRAGYGKDIIGNHCTVFDTLAAERQRHPDHKASLKVLMRRYLNRKREDCHRAMDDADILADIYLAMTANKEVALDDRDLLAKAKSGYARPAAKPTIPTTEADIALVEDMFAAKTVVITGAFKRSRAQIKSILQDAGAKVTSSVSKNTDILIVGDKPGSKLQKAQTLGVQVMDEDKIACFTRFRS